MTGIQIEALNNLLRQAIDHGGDSGGPYFSNKDKTILALKQFLTYVGVREYDIILKDNYPQVKLKHDTYLHGVVVGW